MPVTGVSGSSNSYQASGQPVLRQGASGSAVVELQQKLNAAGFNCGAADGRFGPMTESAVLAFQRARGLSADGVVGPQTWGALGSAAPSAPSAPASGGHPTLSQGARGAAVTEMQNALAQAGFSPGAADGVFGAGTRNAVVSFQRAHGLSADGVCGPQTWGALGSSYTPKPSPTPGPAPAPSGGDPLLRQGASGPSVSKLQQLLKNAGCDPGPVDGQFGAGTAGAVMSYQSSRGLTCDGVVGPQTWHALETGAPAVSGPGPAPSGTLREKILQVAESQIGTLENGSTNNGPCAKYPNYFGRGAESWCADFASWVYTHAGDGMNNPYCPSIVNNLKAEGKWKGRSSPQPGDLVLFDWEGDGVADHVGIVKSVNSNGTIETIEGNSGNSAGVSGVWEHTRSMGTIMGFGNP